MINELVVAAMSLSFFFGSSDEKAATVKGDSAFTCAQINQAAGKLDYGSVNEMLSLSLRQLDKAYTKNSTIETFYRDRLRGNPEQFLKQLGQTNYIVLGITEFLDRYTGLLANGIVEACIEKPKTSVLDAATKVLNDAYQLSKTHPGFATCKAYNEKTVDYGRLMSFVSARETFKQLNSTQTLILEVRDMPSYGDAYLKNEMSRLCAANPGKPVIELLVGVSEVARLREKQRERAEAEEKSRLDEVAVRQKEAEYAQQEFEKYSSSLYKNGADVGCSEYQIQYRKAMSDANTQHRSAYKMGLIATLKDAIKATDPADQQELTRTFLTSDDGLRKVLDYCQMASSGGIIAALNSTIYKPGSIYTVVRPPSSKVPDLQPRR